MANDHRKGKGKGRRDPSPRDRRRDDRDNRSNNRNDDRPYRGSRSDTRSDNGDRRPVRERLGPAPPPPPRVSCDPGPSTSSGTSRRRTRSPSRSSRGSGATPPKVRKEGRTKQAPKPRCLPAFTLHDVESLKLRLAVETPLDLTNVKLDDVAVLAHGLLFLHVEFDTVVFGSPDGSTHAVKGKNVIFMVQKWLKDPHIVKVCTYLHKCIIELRYGVEVVSTLDPLQHRTATTLAFGQPNPMQRDDRNPTEFVLRKAIRKVRTLIATYWDFVVDKSVVKDFDDSVSISPWSRLTLARYADPKGRPSSYKDPLTDAEVVVILDASVYYAKPASIPLADPIDPVRKMSIRSDRHTTKELAERAVWRQDALAKINLGGCIYPICVDKQDRGHAIEVCPRIEAVCIVCRHRGHAADAHPLYDQVVLDNLFRVYAPAHERSGRVWQLQVSCRKDWETYLYGKTWEERHSLEADLPAPRPPTADELGAARAAVERAESDRKLAEFNANIEKAEKAREEERQRSLEIEAREIRFAAPVPAPQRDPTMSHADYIELLKKEGEQLAEIARLRADNAAAAAAIAETARLKARITPMSAEPSSVLATFSHLVATYPTPAVAPAPAAPPVEAAAAPSPTVFVKDLIVPSASTLSYPPAPRPAFTVTVPTPVPSPTKSKPADEQMDLSEASTLLAPRPDDKEIEMTPQEIEQALNPDDEESVHYPSDEEDDEDENEGNITVPGLEEDDILEDDVIGDANADVHMSEERVP